MMDDPDVQQTETDPFEFFCEALKDNDPQRAIAYLIDPVFRYRTPLGPCLIECAKHGNFTTVDFILNLRCNVHTSLSYTDKLNRRALHYAAMYGPLESVIRLVRAGSAVNCCDLEGFTPLLCACKSGRSDIVQYLIKEGAHINSSKTYKYGETALHIASKHGNAETVAVLVKEGAHVNVVTRNVDGCGEHTALHKAASGGHSSCIEVLCRSGLTKDIPDSVGKSALHVAAERGDVMSIEMLHRNGSLINAQDQTGKTAVALAVVESYVEALKLLIYLGADLNISDNRGLSPLHSAVVVRNYELVDILLKAGIQINCQTIDTLESPLMVSLSMGTPDIADLLLNNGADPNLCDFKCYSPLHRCQTVGHADEIKERFTELLLQAGAKLNSRDHQGHIPLNRSIFTGAIRGRQSIACIKQLVESGSHLSPDTGAQIRNSPLYWLCSDGKLPVAAYLVQCGWNLSAESWIQLPGKNPEQTHLHHMFRMLNSTPHSLKIFCRGVVRAELCKAVGDREIVSAVHCLPLPQTVKNFLCLKTCQVSNEDSLLLENH